MGEVIFVLSVIVIVGAGILKNARSTGDSLFGDSSFDELSAVTVGETSLRRACSMLKGTCNKDGTYGKGKINGFDFTVKIEQDLGFAVFVSHKLPVSGLMSIKRENLVSRLKKDLGKEDVLVGDRYFDDKMLIEASDPWWLAAVLNVNNRKLIIELSEKADSFSISNSWIRISLTQYGSSAEKLVWLIKKAVSVSGGLSVKGSLKKMLIHNLFYDPEPRVRLNNLRMLSSRFPRSKELTRIYGDVMNDPSVDLQIEAASLLSEKGMPRLLTILKKKEDSVDAVKIIDIFSENRYVESADTLKEVFIEKNVIKIRVAVLKAFEAFGDNRLSSFLAERLDKHSGNVLIHVVKALGTCGTLEAVEKLHSLSKKGRGAKIREEAAGAMAQIQSRLGVDKGWLSVAELSETDGALSVAKETPEGALSMTDKKEKKK